MSYTKFIILSQERTGSTLLQMLLASDSHVISLGELFNPKEAIRRKASSVKYYLDENEEAVTFLKNRVYRPHPDTIEAVGFKLFYTHGYQEQWRPLWDYVTQTPLRIIHLKRQNLLDRYLSLQLALRSDRWIVQQGVDKPVPSEPIALDADACFKDFHKTVWYYRKVEEQFRQHAVLNMTYEALAANTEEEMRRVQAFLHLPPRPLSSHMVKQRQKSKPELIANYEALKAELQRYIEKGWAEAAWLDFFDDN